MSNSTNGSFGYISCESGATSCTSDTKGFNFSNSNIWIPKGYMKLNLLAPNSFFTTSSLLSTSNLNCGSNIKTCYKNNKAISCNNGFFVKADQTCDATCDSNTNPTYISGLTGSENSGFCSSACNTSNTCLMDFTNYNTNFTCKPTFNKLYLYCYSDNDKLKGAIHYSQYFNSPNFSYSVSPTLSKYYFEIWFYPDKRFIPNSTDYNLLVLLTSGIRIKKATLTSENDYRLYDSNGNSLGNAFTLNFLNWYRLAFSVTQNGSNYDYSFFYNKYSSSYLNQSSTSNLSLSSISFCTTCSPNTDKWFSGFYRWLRIWKGDFLNINTLREMDKL